MLGILENGIYRANTPVIVNDLTGTITRLSVKLAPVDGRGFILGHIDIDTRPATSRDARGLRPAVARHPPN